MKLTEYCTSIALYGCGTWTYNTHIEKRMHTFKMCCYKRILGVTWKMHRTNISVKQVIQALAGIVRPRTETARRRKLQLFGDITRTNGWLTNTIMHGAAEERRGAGKRRIKGPKDIKRWYWRKFGMCEDGLRCHQSAPTAIGRPDQKKFVDSC